MGRFMDVVWYDLNRTTRKGSGAFLGNGEERASFQCRADFSTAKKNPDVLKEFFFRNGEKERASLQFAPQRDGGWDQCTFKTFFVSS